MTRERARAVHLVVAVFAGSRSSSSWCSWCSGEAILVDEDPPGLVARTYRYFAYFTIQSNVLVAITSTVLARNPVEDRLGLAGRPLAGSSASRSPRLVYFTLLRDCWSSTGQLAGRLLLHQVVPVLALAAWAVAGPRPRIGRRETAYALAWPVAWLCWTLVVGQVDGWVPYPFLDAGEEGWGAVGIACAGITILFLLLFALYGWLDRRLRPAPR